MTEKPLKIEERSLRFDAFGDGKVVEGKRCGRLPAMGWNSWNAFGSGNNEALTRSMADRIVELGLDKLGYRYIVLDDGCYKPERIDGVLHHEEEKFPSGFRKLADDLHAMGLKFGMYNDIGTNLCAGAAVGTCGHEETDAKTYLDWDIDFIKVDNCYYPWDNATFSNSENARFTYGPNIKGIRIAGSGIDVGMPAKEGEITGTGASLEEEDGTVFVTGIGTLDGTGPENSPVGEISSELMFKIDAAEAGEADLFVTYSTGREAGVGSWLQVAVGEKEETEIFYDDLLPETDDKTGFIESDAIHIRLHKGENILRLMNHRRQENTLCSYAALVKGFETAFAAGYPRKEVILSICEWGKTGPHHWGYKVGDAWRILNDITFQVGSDGDPGHANWSGDYTTGVVNQYSKAVIMDEFAGLDRGWNDPDMMMIGMAGLNETMCKSHMAMWCMLNAPLMLGLDLRKVEKGDAIYRIIANADLIALNQDVLGIQAKRILCSAAPVDPDKTYIREKERVDVLAKPLSDGSVALGFFNIDDRDTDETISVDIDLILRYIGAKMQNADSYATASEFEVKDLWTGEISVHTGRTFEVHGLKACDSIILKVSVK